jgi:hypothetical protein
MIFVIAPLVKGETWRAWRLRLSIYCAGLLVAGASMGIVCGLAGHVLGLSRVPAWALSGLLGALVLRELGLIALPLPSRNWQMPSSWHRLGRHGSAMAFGATMGVGVLTRAPMASFHGLLVVEMVLSSILIGGGLGATYGIGRAIPVIVAGAMRRQSSHELLPVSRIFLGQQQAWRLLGGLAMSLVAGIALATRGVPLS